MPATLRIPGNTVTGLPVRPPNTMLTNGSLLLIDPADPADPLAGDPANGTTLTNLAWEHAAAAIGSGDKATLAATLNSTLTTTDAVLERTTRGGIHFLISQTNDVVGQFATINVAAPLATHIGAALTAGHDLYFSTWDIITRKTRSGTGATMIYRMNGGGGTVYMLSQANSLDGAISVTPAAPRNLSTETGAATGAFRRHIAVDGGPAGWSTAIDPRIAYFGPTGSSSFHSAPSLAVQRLYIEDLTVSGRTPADAAALDARLYAEQVTAPWGRYHHDTPTTDPNAFA